MSVRTFLFSFSEKLSYLVEIIYKVGKKAGILVFHLKITSKKMKKN